MIFTKKAYLKERGDTIVEVLIAMAVLGMILGTAFAIANRSYAVGISAQERTEAVKIAESQIELLRLGSEVTDSSILAPVNANELFCIDPNAADLSRVVYTGDVQEITGTVDPIVYDPDCTFGTDSRYKVSIEQSGTNNETYSVRVRWESVLGSLIEEVEHVYRTYDFQGSYSLIAPTNFTVVNGCTDSAADNYNPAATPGNPDSTNCTYPVVNGCTDSAAFNYNPAATPGNPDSTNCDYTKPVCNANTSSGQPYIYFYQFWINPIETYTTSRIIAWAYSGGYNNSDIINRGFAYSTSSSTELTIESIDSGTALFEADNNTGNNYSFGYTRTTISNLRPSKTYYSRAFIETVDCVAYGPTNTINTRTLNTSRYRFIADRGNSSYYLSNDRTAWTTARYYARAYEGNLATISNIQENNFIRNNARPLLPQNSSLPNDSWIWLGLNDRSSEGNFVWDSGQNSSFRNWYNPQPDNYLNNEDYVHMNMDVNGRWNDISNTSNMRYIIEYEGL